MVFLFYLCQNQKRKTMLGNLDNEVIFKKAFTNKFVLQCFVKDIFGIDFEPAKIETEKRFRPKIAHIDLKYDIFAESVDKRVIVEIQKVDYDYNFDRFLLYHNMAIAEQQRSSKEYKAEKVVLTVVVFTEKYFRIRDRQGEPVEHDILLGNNNLFTFDQQEVDVFGHKLVLLNHQYLKNTTPQGYRDWLQLIRESIMHPENPNVNMSNHGVKKVSELIEYDNLSPEELTESKNKHAAETVKRLNALDRKQREEEEKQIAEKAKLEGKLEGKREIAKSLKAKGIALPIIAQTTGLSLEEIETL